MKEEEYSYLLIERGRRRILKRVGDFTSRGREGVIILWGGSGICRVSEYQREGGRGILLWSSRKN